MSDLITEEHSGWSPSKVAAFKESFFEFLKHVKIDSKEKGQFILADGVYEAQRRFLDGVFTALADDIHDIKCLKSRQLGVSTIARALSVFWLGVHDGLKGAMVLDTEPHKEEARKEIEDMISRLPSRLKFPTVLKSNRYGITLSNGSALQFMTAGIRNSNSGGALGRGSGINFVHASEICMFQNDEGLSSFKKSLAKDFPNRLYIWESTGRGFNSWWRIWNEAKNDDLSQKTVFIGWWAKENQRIKIGSRLFERYGEPPITAEEQKRIDEVEQRYGHRVDIEQLAWYRKEANPLGYGNGDDGDIDDQSDDEYFGREQPWVEEESFAEAGSTFFPAEKLTLMQKTSVSLNFKAYFYAPGAQFVDCMIHPAVNRRMTHLKVWEEPDIDGVYVVSADPAHGHDEKNDRSAIQVLRCYADKVEQVAEYAYSGIQTHQFAWVIASLMGWYKNTRLILEMNGPGGAVWREYSGLKQLLTQGYLRGPAEEKGIRDILTNVKNYIYTRTDAMGPGHVYQWLTTSRIKVEIMERMRDLASNGTLAVRSQDLVEEMRSIARDGDSIAASGSGKDDRVMAMAMGIRAWEQQERRGLISQGRTKEYEVAKKRLTAQDQMALMNKYQLSNMFKRKDVARALAARNASRASWRGR